MIAVVSLSGNAAYDSAHVALGFPATTGFRQQVSPLPVAETVSAAADQGSLHDLISFLKAIPDGRYRPGVPWFVQPIGPLTGLAQ